MNPFHRFSLVLALLTPSCAALWTSPDHDEDTDRLQFFPTTHLPTNGDLSISWDPHMIPFITAEKDEDVPFALGLIHAHLRIGQLELMRHLSQGRVSELAGPFTIDVDRSLRVLDLGHSAKATLAAMQPESRLWAERFLLGINTYIERNATRVPADLRALGVAKLEPWTLEDLATVWRLAAVDVNWSIYVQILQIEDQATRDQVWSLLQGAGAQSIPSVALNDGTLGELLFNAAKTGSNSVVVGKDRTGTGSGFIASDPHLGLFIPNTWLVAGFRSPSYHVLGLMIPSLPFVALGRNPYLAWGGTNMWALSTYLYALSDADVRAAEVTEETIKVRGWFDRTVTRRFTPVGPIISDSPLFKGKLKPTAMKWVGYGVSDELEAFLKANRATTFNEFRQSFATYAVSAQNLLVADNKGNIGHVLAYEQPLRTDPKDHSLIQPISNAWTTAAKPTELPYAYNPASGFIASANNKPFDDAQMHGLPDLGWFYQSSDRVTRLKDLIQHDGKVTLQSLMDLQRDTYSPSGVKIRDLVVKSGPTGDAAAAPVWHEFTAWDGFYRGDSQGPVAFETIMSELAPAVFSKIFPPANLVAAAMIKSVAWKSVFLNRVGQIPAAELRALVTAAVTAAQAKFAKFSSWQQMHRVAVAHPLVNVPMVGSRYRFDEFGVSGGADTVMKTATSLNGDKDSAYYGTNARHISDLSDVDANYFVLFGGQDGWLLSAQTLDQVPLWREGRYIKLPLSDDNRDKVYSRKLTLKR